MQIGKIVGSVVASQKDEKLEGLKLLVVQVHDQQNEPCDQYVVAADSVQAGVGDIVLYATGSRRARALARRRSPRLAPATRASWPSSPRGISGARTSTRSGAAEAVTAVTRASETRP
jgi:microcompartment protein CcmK/EutM